MRRGTFLDYLTNPDRVTSHGSAEFGGYWEQRKLLKPSNKGVYISDNLRLSSENSYKNLILISPTGGGKSTRFILNQALRRWESGVSLIFFDPSSEIRSFAENWLVKKQKFQPIFLDLTNPDTSAKYNFLLTITDKSSARIIAESIINVIYENSSDDLFWVESAISILTLIILAVVLKMPEEQRTLAFVNRLINKVGHSDEEVNALMELALEEDDFNEYCSFVASSYKVKQSIIATVKSAMYIYSENILKTICAKSTFSLEDLRNKRTVLFLSQEEHKIPYFKSFWNLFYRQLFESLMNPNNGNDVYCFMDEFANIGAIPNITSIISTVRKKRVHLSLILQSYDQLVDVYGNQKAKIILENCNSKLFYGGLSYESCRIVSDMIGVMTETYSEKGIFESNEPVNRTTRRLMTPDEVRTLSENECLFIHGNHKPFKLKTKPFFKNSTLKKRSKL